MAHVTLGPFLVNNDQTGLAASNLEHAGYSMEISSDKFAQNICRYRQINARQPNALRLEDFHFSLDHIPFALLTVAEPQKQSTAVGTLVSLEAMLGGWRKYTRNIRSNPMGGRPRSPFGSCGSMTASSFARGMRSPMRVRNFSRRVVFFLVANSAWEKLG